MSVMAAIGVQEPRVWSAPPFESSAGSEAIELAASAGLILDPGQEFVIERGLGERSPGKWASFEDAVCEPRQNGKGAILETRELAGLFLFGERLLIHSAHEFATATEARVRMEDILSGSPELSRRVRSVNRSHGSEGFTLKSGQRLLYKTRTKGGGRGFTADCVILDEAMFIQEAFIGALLPTMAAKSIDGNPQMWYMGSSVDQTVHDHGIVFARIRERGIKGDQSLAYFEWSVGDPGGETDRAWTPDRPEVADLLADEDAWAQANPGLGIRISAAHIDNEMRSMGSREFAVERLGIGDWPATDGSGAAVIDIAKWDALVDAESRLVDPVGLAFDVSPDRSSASISAAGSRPDGLAHLEVIDHRRGTGWVADRIVELAGRHEPLGVFCDATGPAASLVHELETRGITVTTVNATEHAQACGQLFDMVEQKTGRHLGTSELRAAVKGAAKRPLGDAWAWSRKSSGVDISPLVACTLAFWGAATVEPDHLLAWAFA